MMKIHLDFETRSTLDLTKVGAFRYAMHPSTEITCMSFAKHDQKVPTILGAKDLTQAKPQYLADDVVTVAHSAHFEFAIWNFILHKRHGWPALWDPKRWSCTLARAAACNLPQKLYECGHTLAVPHQKDLMGRQAMMKTCRPVDFDPISQKPVYNEDPEVYKTLFKYCAGDVLTERGIDARLPELPPLERKIWELDLVMNLRGVGMDLDLARNAESMAAKLTEELNTDLVRLTNGAVTKASRVAEIKRWLLSQGVKDVDSLDKEAVTNLLNNPNVSPLAKDVLNIRRQVGKTSTSKYSAVLAVTNETDNRARGLLQYHGASTGRWAGRLIQPHNFPKGVDEASQKAAIDLIVTGDHKTFSFIYGNGAMDALSGALRGTIIAAPGKKLMVADYASIEVRVLLWLAGEEASLNKIKEGINLYVDMAKFIYQNPNITKKGNPTEYAVGKFTILGSGYGMGKDRFQAQCATSGVTISLDLAGQAIRSYRDKHRRVVAFWKETEAAVRQAIKSPGTVHPSGVGRGVVYWGMDPKREFLCCKLPSGRYLRYFRPSVREEPSKFNGEPVDTIFYHAAGLGGRLEEFSTYGGSLVENVTQAVARDLMAEAMLRCEEAGYPVIITVHDEIVAEVVSGLVESGSKTIGGFIKLLCTLPLWAGGCPVEAEGWVGDRYRK